MKDWPKDVPGPRRRTPRQKHRKGGSSGRPGGSIVGMAIILTVGPVMILVGVVAAVAIGYLG